MATTVLRIPIIHSRHATHLAHTTRFWNSALLSGVIGGLVMAAVMMLVAGTQGESLFAPANAVAATLPAYRPPVMDRAVLAPTSVGMLLHLLVAIGWAGVFAVAASLRPRWISHYSTSVWLGIALGIVSWAVTGMWIGPALDPVLRSTPPAQDLIFHLIFGVATALSLTGLLRSHAHRASILSPDQRSARGSDYVRKDPWHSRF